MVRIQTIFSYIFFFILIYIYSMKAFAIELLTAKYTYNFSDYNLSVTDEPDKKLNFLINKGDTQLQSWRSEIPSNCSANQLKWSVYPLAFADKQVGWIVTSSPGCCCDVKSSAGDIQKRDMSNGVIITIQNDKITHQPFTGMKMKFSKSNKNMLTLTYYAYTGAPAQNLIMPHVVRINSSGTIQEEILSQQQIESLIYLAYPQESCMTMRLYQNQCEGLHPNDSGACQAEKIAESTCESQLKMSSG